MTNLPAKLEIGGSSILSYQLDKLFVAWCLREKMLGRVYWIMLFRYQADYYQSYSDENTHTCQFVIEMVLQKVGRCVLNNHTI